MERDITIAQGRRKLEQHLDAMLEGEEVRLSRRVRELLEEMRVEWRELDRRIEAFDDEFAALAKTDAVARRLVSIPRRLPCPRQRSSARQHGHVARTISADRHRAERHGQSGNCG